MNIDITGRHIEVTPAIRAHVEEQMAKLDEIWNGKPARAHVIIEVERGMHRAEIVINWWNETLTADTVLDDMYQSIGQTVDKIEKQARRLKDKVIDRSHHATPVSELATMMEADEAT